MDGWMDGWMDSKWTERQTDRKIEIGIQTHQDIPVIFQGTKESGQGKSGISATMESLGLSRAQERILLDAFWTSPLGRQATANGMVPAKQLPLPSILCRSLYLTL
jgi:hypothetical protein